MSDALSIAILFFTIAFFATACADAVSQPPSSTTAPGMPGTSATGSPTETPLPSPTTPAPTPTPRLAAVVNGEPILLEAYEQELIRYEMAQAELGLAPDAEGQAYQRLVLDALIERALIGQAAQAAGIQISPRRVDDKIADLQETANEMGRFEEWLAANRWTLEEFRTALAQEMLVEAMVAHVTAGVPTAVEQVRASYIQVDDAALAEDLLAQIKDGADFGDLAARYSRDMITAPAGGDLGFFAPGSLLVPQVEEVAYALQTGDVSDVISVTDPQSGRTIHYIVKVTDRDPQRPLNTNLRQQLLEEAFNTWLDELWSGATIVYLLDEP